jgi:transposase
MSKSSMSGVERGPHKAAVTSSMTLPGLSGCRRCVCEICFGSWLTEMRTNLRRRQMLRTICPRHRAIVFRILGSFRAHLHPPLSGRHLGRQAFSVANLVAETDLMSEMQFSSWTSRYVSGRHLRGFRGFSTTFQFRKTQVLAYRAHEPGRKYSLSVRGSSRVLRHGVLPARWTRDRFAAQLRRGTSPHLKVLSQKSGAAAFYFDKVCCHCIRDELFFSYVSNVVQFLLYIHLCLVTSFRILPDPKVHYLLQAVSSSRACKSVTWPLLTRSARIEGPQQLLRSSSCSVTSLTHSALGGSSTLMK